MQNVRQSMALGAWAPGPLAPEFGVRGVVETLMRLDTPVSAVCIDGRVGVASGGTARFGAAAGSDEHVLLGYVGAMSTGALGDPSFASDHGVRESLVFGEMANGIASEALVEAARRVGCLGVFGAAGLSLERVRAAIARLKGSIGERGYGVNLIHSPSEPALESALVDLLLEERVPLVSASAFLDLTLPIVRYRVTGIHRDPSGRIVVPHRVMAKVSRTEVARKFFEPPPERFLAELVASKVLTEAQAELARQIPMADDVTAEADSGGHTDNRPLVLLLPSLRALRDEVTAARRYDRHVRVGAAGGIATPASLSAAYSMGAAYVIVGSIMQGTLEAGTSDAVRAMLAEAGPTDVAMAPAADMFEMGVKVQVLTRGTMFAVRATRLYELYRAYESVAALPSSVRDELEKKYFKASLDEAWEGCRRYFSQHDPAQLERAERDPKHQLALLFRAYLGQASKWANAGVADRKLDYQVWCGPAMGAFNDWARGTFLEDWRQRRAGTIARNLLVGAAYLSRVAAFRAQGVALPASVEAFAPRHDEALVVAPTTEARVTPAEAPIRSVAAKSSDEPIAIVGIGAMFPNAPNARAFWRLLRTGHDAIGDVPATHWSVADYYDADPSAPDKTYAKRGGFLGTHAFDPTEFGIPPAVLEATDTAQLLGLTVAKMALEDAGYGDGRAWDRSRASVLLGVTGTQELVIALGARLGHPKWRKALRDAGIDDATADDVVRRISESYVGWQENSFPGLLGNVVAGRIANRLDFGGTNCVLDAACASSLAAIHLAMLELRAGTSDVVLGGGVDCLNDIFMHMCFSKTPALSATGDVRPFGAKADGTLLGEGLGMVVLKRLSDAERDDDRIYAVIRSVGTSSDGRAKSIYAPLPTGQARALRNAQALAGVRPSDIALVEAHGTGTKAGDVAEFEGLTTVFREDPREAPCVLGSVKSQIGHTKAAAGVAGLIKASLALHHKVFPPTLKADPPNPALALGSSPFTITTVARPWLSRDGVPRLAGVSSFGFGGSNFHAILAEHSAIKAEPAWDGSVELLAFSSDDVTAMLASARAYVDAPMPERTELARRARAAFRASHRHRVVAWGLAARFPLEAFASTLSAIERDPSRAHEAAKGAVRYGVGASEGKLAFVFPGQGSQHVDMARELATVFPELLDAVTALGALRHDVYPLPTFDAERRREREQALTRTDRAQPAIGAVSRGLAGILARFGVRPELCAGHSYGELVALHVAGALDAQGLALASARRGELMARADAGRGAMLAVFAPRDVVESVVRSSGLDVVLANRNGPKQNVLSGTREAIEAAERAFAERDVRAVRLSVGAAFHSPLVEDAAAGFRAALDAVPVFAPSIPVLAGATATPYPSAPDAVRATLGAQLREPVAFDATVEAMHAAGARTFVEVGPKATLTGLVRSILDGKSFVAVAMDAQSSAGALVDLAAVLGTIAACGHDLDLRAWDHEARPRHAPAPIARKPKMTIPLSGANYRAPFEPLPPRAPRAEVIPMSKRDERSPVASIPAAVSAPSAAPPRDEVLRAHADSLRAIAALQEQTARVHQVFLEGQRAAQQGMLALLGGASMPVVPMTTTPMLTAAPAPIATANVLPAVSTHAEPSRADAPPAVPDAPSAPTVTAATPPAPSPGADVAKELLRVVATTTGYPEETLSLEMEMESDLGIDSIKRVEILSMLSKAIPGAPRVDPEKLSTLKTLADVVRFVGGALGATTTVASATNARPTKPNGAAHASTNGAARGPAQDTRAILFDVVSTLTGYPVDTLSLEMEMESDLGIDSIKRVEILSTLSKRIEGAPSVDPEKLRDLRTLGHVLAFVSKATTSVAVAPTPPVAPVPAATTRAADGLAPTTPSSTVRHVVVATGVELVRDTRFAWPEAPIALVGEANDLMQSLANKLRELGVQARVATTFEGVAAGDAVGGCIVLAPRHAKSALDADRFVKRAITFARDRAAELRRAGGVFVAVSARDGAFGFVEPGATAPHDSALAGLVKTIAHEWPEVRARAIDVDESRAADANAEAVIEAIRAAGPLEIGISSAGVVTLATHAVPAVVQERRLGRGDVVVVSGGARGVTSDCARELAKETGASLVLLGRTAWTSDEPAWLQGAKDDAAIKKALVEHASGGARPSPKQLGEKARAILAERDVRDAIRALRDEGIDARYRSVDVRDADALRACFEQIRRECGPIRGLIHGAGVLRDKRIEDKRDEDVDVVYDTKVVGARALLDAARQDDLVLVAFFASVSGRFGRRGQVDYAMANQALVSIAATERARRRGARVVAIDWGPWDGGMVTPALRAEFEREGVFVIPLDEGARAFVAEALAPADDPFEVLLGGPLSGKETARGVLTAHWTLDADAMPVLAHHKLGGKAVWPLAMTIELFARSAARLGLGRVRLEDVRVLRGVSVGATPESVSVWATPGDGASWRFELRGATGHVHVRAVARPLHGASRPTAMGSAKGLAPFTTPLASVYGEQLFHGKSLEAIQSVMGLGREGMSATLKTCASSEVLLGRPSDAFVTDPLAIDGVFQALIVWCRSQLGAPSLPSHVGAASFFGAFPAEGVRANVRVRSIDGANVTSDIDLLDDGGNVVARLESFVCTASASLDRAFAGDASVPAAAMPSA